MGPAVVLVHVYWFIMCYNSGCALFVIKSALPQVLLQRECARVFMSETVMCADNLSDVTHVCVCIYISVSSRE